MVIIRVFLKEVDVESGTVAKEAPEIFEDLVFGTDVKKMCHVNNTAEHKALLTKKKKYRAYRSEMKV